MPIEFAANAKSEKLSVGQRSDDPHCWCKLRGGISYKHVIYLSELISESINWVRYWV